MDEQSFSRTGWAGAVMLLVFAVIAGLLWVVGEANSGSAATPPSSATPTTGQQGDDSCWVVKVDGNDAGNRVIATGLSGSPEKVQASLLKAAKADPSALVALYNMSPLANKQTLTESDVASDGCYTAAGKQAWFALVAELNKPAVKTVNKTAPANGCNTFVVNGKVIVKCERILGNRNATKIVWGDGSVTWVLHRCGNPMTPGKPPHNPPSSHHKCPPGQVVSSDSHICIVPKDPSEDPMNNPDVPGQVKGPGTTPAGGNPGPATNPTDSPTGCNGPCPGSGGGGNNGGGGGNDSPLPDPTEDPDPAGGNPEDPVGGDQDPPPPPP